VIDSCAARVCPEIQGRELGKETQVRQDAALTGPSTGAVKSNGGAAAADDAAAHSNYLVCTDARVAPVEIPPSTSNVCPLT
jgi:hypothetical protein